MIDFNTYEMNKEESRLMYLAIAISSIALALLFYRNIAFALIIIPLVPKIREFIIEELKEHRKKSYEIQFKDFLYIASTAFGAGRSMKEMIKVAIPELQDIYGKKSILANELSKAYERMDVGGENDIDVLMDFAIASRMDDCMDFVTIYSICKTTGASLVIALNKAASVIIDKMTIEKEIKEIVRRKKMEGLMIFLMPIGILLFLNIFAPDYIAPMYSTWTGKVIMTGVIVVNIAVYKIIKRITRVEI